MRTRSSRRNASRPSSVTATSMVGRPVPSKSMPSKAMPGKSMPGKSTIARSQADKSVIAGSGTSSKVAASVPGLIETLTTETKGSATIDSLVREHQQFAQYLANRLVGEFKLSNEDREELLGAAYLGLVEAAQRFDPKTGTRFRTYSFLRIRGAMIDHLRENSLLPRGFHKKVRAFTAASNLRESTPIDQRGLSIIEKQRVAVELISNYSLIMRLNMECEELADHRDIVKLPDEAIDQRMRGSIIRTLIEKLPADEKLVITKFYLQDLNFSEIVDLHSGFTKSWVSRVHKRALASLRRLILSTREGVGLRDEGELLDPDIQRRVAKLPRKRRSNKMIKYLQDGKDLVISSNKYDPKIAR